MVKIVYLDQNVWIKLSRVHHGIKENPGIQKAYDLIREISRSEKAILPLSVIHLTETRNNQNAEQKKRLVSFMIEISKGITIRPYTSILEYEVKSAIFKRIGRPYFNISDIVFGRGISGMLGVKGRLVPKKPDAKPIPEEVKQKIFQIVDSPEALSGGFLYDDEKSKLEEDKNFLKKTIEVMESMRDMENQIEDKDLRYRFRISTFLSQQIVPIIAKIVVEEKISRELLNSKLDTREKWENFLEDMPSLNTLFKLTYKRDQQENRPIQENDFWDISALSIAIPYCDVVITEKMFASIAKQSKLDSIYKTQILTLSEIGDLPGYLQEN